MNTRIDPRARRSWHFKAMVLALATVCVLLGLAGLLLPIIPGVLFFCLAALLLSHVSVRIDRWRRRSPAMQHMQRRVSVFATLGWGDRLRACFWFTLEAVIDGANAVRRGVGRLLALRGGTPST